MREINLRHNKAGIYCYRRLTDGVIVYIGKDANLVANRRHYDHNRQDFKTGKRGQLVNKVLQDNPQLYVYEQVLFCGLYWMEALEEKLIDEYRPEFNIVGNDSKKKFKGDK